MKYGGELQPRDHDVAASTLDARKRFLNLVASETPEIVINLLRPCRLDALPDLCWDLPEYRVPGDWIATQQLTQDKDRLLRFFFYHLKDQSLYSEDVQNLGCADNVRDTPVLAYFDFFHRNQTEFQEMAERARIRFKRYEGMVGSSEFVSHEAMTDFIPNWIGLNSHARSGWICEQLREWADTSGLSDDWSLDFALRCLGTLKTGFVDKVHPEVNFVQNGHLGYILRRLPNRAVLWQNIDPWKRTLVQDSLAAIYQNTDFISGLPPNTQEAMIFDYRWPTELLSTELMDTFQVRGYYSPFSPNAKVIFLNDVEEQFWARFTAFYSNKWRFCVGYTNKIANEIKCFRKQLTRFLGGVHRALEPFTEATVKKRDGDKHLLWLIDYQIKKMPYATIARAAAVNHKAVRSGIQSAAKMIGLTLREPTKGGRKLGSSDRQKRRSRVNRQ